MGKTVKTLFTNGDSWAFGSEIMAPEFCMPKGQPGAGMAGKYKAGYDCSMPLNDFYRVPKIWASHLGKHLNAEVVNWARPARSNDTIYDSTIAWVLENYVMPGRDVSDLTVVIGWSSPERKDIVIEDNDDKIRKFTLWPAMQETKYYSSDIVKAFFKFYVTHMWVEQEYFKRFIQQCFNLQNFFERQGINYYMFNSFYMPSVPTHPDNWKNVNLLEMINAWKNLDIGWADHYYSWSVEQRSLLNQWALIDADRFIGKDTETFSSYIQKNVQNYKRMNNWHPSPDSHEAWAAYLATKIK